MKNCYWGYLRYGFEIPVHYYDNERTRNGVVESKTTTISDETKKKNLKAFLKAVGENYFWFGITDNQLGEFESLFLSIPEIKDKLIYRSKKFNNRSHMYPSDRITLFIFSNHE